MWCNIKIIITGNKDPSTDLWTLPIGPNIEQTKKPIADPTIAPPASRPVGQSPKKSITVPSDAHDGSSQVASFTHSVKTRATAVKFAHQ